MTPGYADTSRPLEELLQTAVDARVKDRKPFVIWICDIEDERGNDQLEKSVFYDEKVGLALKRFVCLKAEIQSMPDERAAEKLSRKAPLFYFFDPAGKQFQKPLYGKRASSRKGFSSMVDKLWDVSYEMRLKVYTKKMSKILDQVDKLEAQKKRLQDKMDRAADNPRKLAGMKKEEEKLRSEEAEIDEAEKEIIAGVTLKPEFLPSDENAKK